MPFIPFILTLCIYPPASSLPTPPHAHLAMVLLLHLSRELAYPKGWFRCLHKSNPPIPIPSVLFCLRLHPWGSGNQLFVFLNLTFPGVFLVVWNRMLIKILFLDNTETLGCLNPNHFCLAYRLLLVSICILPYLFNSKPLSLICTGKACLDSPTYSSAHHSLFAFQTFLV